MKRAFSLIVCAAILATLSLASVSTPARSGNVTAADLIAAVNSLRTSYGLPALKENSILDGTAQWTAQYMADNNLSAHIGNVSGRVSAAGFGGGTVFATENWARFKSGTINDIMAVWSDAAHMIPMTNASYTDIGAGVAEGSTGTVYIVHAAYTAGGSGSSSSSSSGTTVSNVTPISQVMEPVITSTPNADGSVVHYVDAGQTLWGIAVAYGVHISEIQLLNNISGSTTIYNGMKLVIKEAPTKTITPSPTATSVRPSRTPTSRVPTKTPTPYHTPTATYTPTPEPLISGLPKLDRRTLGMGIIVLCALGLGVVVTINFRKKS